MKLVLFLKRQSWAAWLTGNSRVGGWLWERGLQRVKSPNKWGHIKILGNHLGIAQDNWHQKWRIGKPNCAFSKWRPLDSPILSYQKYINHFIYNYSVPYLPPPPPPKSSLSRLQWSFQLVSFGGSSHFRMPFKFHNMTHGLPKRL